MIHVCFPSVPYSGQQPQSKTVLACQITALALGVILASAGLIAYLGSTGSLPSSLAFVGTGAAIAFMACGSLAALGALFLPIPQGKTKNQTGAKKKDDPKIDNPGAPITPTLSEEESQQRETIKSAILKRLASTTPPLPPEIFSRSSDNFDERKQRALEICREENLFLLYQSPNSQEPENHLPPEVAGRPLQWIVQDPDLKDYAQTLFEQLVIFACRFYSREEVKATPELRLEYKDIKLSEDGYLESLDIDAPSLLGLLDTYIPFWYRHYLFRVDNNGRNEEFRTLAREPSALDIINQDLDRRREAIALYQRHGITSFSQQLVWDKKKFSKETREVQEGINSILEYVNDTLNSRGIHKSPHLDLVRNRIIFYSLASTSIPYIDQIFFPALEALKQAGYCYHYERPPQRGNDMLIYF
ncbi:MAG: hypothetical protein K940chlam2_01361 [Chlamydiae bacterium]|nr:hypothetical protein [Chlamydiota bacterium]